MNPLAIWLMMFELAVYVKCLLGVVLMYGDMRVLEKYVWFVLYSMTELDRLQEKEKSLVQNINFFNKNKTFYNIWWFYSQYSKTVRSEWEKIYIGTHFYDTMDNWELLGKSGTVYAKTEVQKLVEQYFYGLTLGMNTLIDAYDKKTSDKDREVDLTLWRDVFLIDIENHMKWIFPYALNVFDVPDSLLDVKHKTVFIEENEKHKVDITKKSKFVDKDTPKVRKLIVTEKPSRDAAVSASTAYQQILSNLAMLNKSQSADKVDYPAGYVTGQVPTEVMKQYGEAYLLLFDEATRNEGYRMIEELVPQLPEAGVALGQYYRSTNEERAKRNLRIAMEAGIAEAKWDYACMLRPSYIPDPSNPEDAEWEKYCLEAAEAECREAAHEIGNICHRRGAIAEAAYWYELSYALGYDVAYDSWLGIFGEWIRKRKPEFFVAGTKNYTEARHEASIACLKNAYENASLDEAKTVFDNSLDKMLGYYLGGKYEYENKEYGLSFDIYSKLVQYGYPEAMDKYGKHIMQGKGTSKDYDSGVTFIGKAAKQRNIHAIVSMAKFAELEKDYFTAAYWNALGYARGEIDCGKKLQEFVGKN